MNIVRLALTLAIAGATFSNANEPSTLRIYAFIDAVKAVGETTHKKVFDKEELSDEEVKKINQIISESEPLFNLSPDALAELRALGGPEPKGTAVGAVVLQEAILDYESLTGGKNIPTLIAFYTSQHKTGKLQPIQRFVCYVLLKTSMRKIQAAKEQE